MSAQRAAVSIVIRGEPVPKGRPRFTRQGHAFTPKKTRDYEAKVKAEALRAMTHGPFVGPLRVSVDVVKSVPSSWSKIMRSRALDGLITPVLRPDIDNYLKTLDAFNGVVWKDDAQIVELGAVKRYGTSPRMFVTVEPL